MKPELDQAEKAKRTVALMQSMAPFWIRYMNDYVFDVIQPNTVQKPAPRDGGWGFIAGLRFQLAPGEALLVTTTSGGAGYACFQLTDPWMMSPDARHHQASLNLGQAVLLLGYEWFKEGTDTPAERIDHGAAQPAPREELILLFEHLEDELEKSGFLFPPGNRPGMIRTLRSILHRAQLTDQEVRTLRGVIVALTRGKRRRNPNDMPKG